MDSKTNFEVKPFPLESEFRVLSVRRRLHELSREEVEEFLTEALTIMAKLAHQVTQLRDHVKEIEGKIGDLDQ
jgi:hypothetical protein